MTQPRASARTIQSNWQFCGYLGKQLSLPGGLPYGNVVVWGYERSPTKRRISIGDSRPGAGVGEFTLLTVVPGFDVLGLDFLVSRFGSQQSALCDERGSPPSSAASEVLCGDVRWEFVRIPPTEQKNRAASFRHRERVVR